MAFHEVQFPLGVLLGSSGGPGFNTSRVEGEAGTNEAISRWPNARRQYRLQLAKTWDAMSTVMDFYMARKGGAVGFRHKDVMDFTTAANHRAAHTMTDVVIGTATGTTGSFQCLAQYSDGLGGYTTRAITKPVQGTALFSRQTGVASPVQFTSNFSINTTTGLFTVTAAGAGMQAGDVIRWGGEYDTPVQFGDDLDKLFAPVYRNYDLNELPDIQLVEMLGDVVSPERFYYGGASLITAGPFNVTFALGRAIVYTGGTTTALMPDPTDLELGGPYFHIVNGGAGTMAFKTNDGVTTILSLASTKSVIWCVYNDGSANKWLPLSN